MRTSPLLLWLILLLACPRAPVLLRPLPSEGLGLDQSVLVDGGGLQARVAPPDDAQIVLFYGGEQRGSMEPCGCSIEPRGSLYRVESYVTASARPGVPSLLLNPGYWLDDSVSADEHPTARAQVSNDWMLRGLEAGGWDALNLTAHDAPWLVRAARSPATALSANLRPQDPGASWPPTHLSFHEAGLRVVVTGVTGATTAWSIPPGWRLTDPVEAVREVAHTAEADLLIVLAYDVNSAAEELLDVPGVDVLIEADHYLERYPPSSHNQALWLRSSSQTKRLGELRLRVEGGHISAAQDRRINMDSQLPRGERTGPLATEALAAIRAARLRTP